jgi:NADH-quinone oxidoreductase subunit E
MPLSQALKERVVNDYFPRYPTKRAALMPALWLAQDELGWLSTETLEEIAELLEMDPTDVESVASFYVMFNLRPIGRKLIEVCENPSCWVNGASQTLERICQRLGLDPHAGHAGATTPDGEYTVRPTECVAACDYAPAVQVNWRYYGPVTPERVDEFLADMERFALERDGLAPAFGTHEARFKDGSAWNVDPAQHGAPPLAAKPEPTEKAQR